MEPRSSIGELLPGWVFDVDEEDDIDSSVPLLKELEVDFGQIIRTVIWVTLYPWTSLCNSGALGAMPFSELSHEFWGPFLVVLLYGLVLLWGQFKVCMHCTASSFCSLTICHRCSSSSNMARVSSPPGCF